MIDPMIFEGFEVIPYRAPDGIITVMILTHDAEPKDTYTATGVPRLRIVVNDSSEVTTEDGPWRTEE